MGDPTVYKQNMRKNTHGWYNMYIFEYNDISMKAYFCNIGNLIDTELLELIGNITTYLIRCTFCVLQ